MTACIDTNVVLRMLGRSAPFSQLRQGLIERRFVWALSTEILLEYEEVAARELGIGAAGQLMRLIEILNLTRGVVRFVSPSFRFRAIPSDVDDNKFSDCAITADADFVITEDRHFHALSDAGYKPVPISPADFVSRFLA